MGLNQSNAYLTLLDNNNLIESHVIIPLLLLIVNLPIAVGADVMAVVARFQRCALNRARA
jgi:hypothetical protein